MCFVDLTLGTPRYLLFVIRARFLVSQSPEVMSSQPYDFKSDMWSLGCILYEMMSLKHAFDATDMTSLVMKILRGEHLPIPQQFSAELRDLIKQLLSRSPKSRPSCEQILKMPFLKVRMAGVHLLDLCCEGNEVAGSSLLDCWVACGEGGL
jgi:serine/threonine protein kinase